MCRYISKPCPELTPSRLSKGIFIFSGDTPPAVLPPALGSQTSGRCGATGTSPKEATKMLQGREKLCYGNRLRAGCDLEEVTHFWLTLAMNQYHSTWCWCSCWDLKKFEEQSIKISVTQKYKPGRQALRSLHSSINVTKDLLLLQPQSKLQFSGETPDAKATQEAAPSTHPASDP